MKHKILLSMVIVLTLLLASAWAADVTGKWEAEQPGRGEGAAPTKTTFNFKAAGATLTGNVILPGFMGGEPTTVDITEGKVDGNNIQFVVVRKMDMQGQTMEMKSTYKGVVAGDEITFTVERQRPAGGMGGPGGGAPGGGAGGMGPGGGMGGGQPRPPLVAKRVK